MGMRCKQCSESFPKNQPFDMFEMRRHKLLPADSDGMTHTDVLEDGGMFCSRKCLGDYLRSGDKSGVFDLGSVRKKLDG
ncbi:MAG TPA: hypothetical protein VNT81_01005 [Vicinamibacterales bacterium]|nr:hypothetical protein [Vicinamibacterales bacterium]